MRARPPLFAVGSCGLCRGLLIHRRPRNRFNVVWVGLDPGFKVDAHAVVCTAEMLMDKVHAFNEHRFGTSKPTSTATNTSTSTSTSTPTSTASTASSSSSSSSSATPAPLPNAVRVFQLPVAHKVTSKAIMVAGGERRRARTEAAARRRQYVGCSA